VYLELLYPKILVVAHHTTTFGDTPAVPAEFADANEFSSVIFLEETALRTIGAFRSPSEAPWISCGGQDEGEIDKESCLLQQES
jgi:hypothetical protein